MEDWEHDAHELLAPLRRSVLEDEGVEELVEKSVDLVKESIGAADFVEFATAVLVVEFLGPILDVFAFALGLEEEDGSESTGKSKTQDQ